MRRIALAIVIVGLIGCCRFQDTAADVELPALPAPTTRPANAPVAAVWFERSGLVPPSPVSPSGPPEERNRLIMGVWSDGTVVWSDNRATGGRPYYIGRIPRGLVAKLTTNLGLAGLFDVPGEVWFGPDSSFSVIAAEANGKRKWLGSWHDPPSTRPGVVVGDRGMSALDPAELRPKHSPAYAKFLEVWAESRRLIESVVPEANGRPLNEELDDAVFDIGREKKH